MEMLRLCGMEDGSLIYGLVAVIYLSRNKERRLCVFGIIYIPMRELSDKLLLLQYNYSAGVSKVGVIVCFFIKRTILSFEISNRSLLFLRSLVSS